MACTRFSSDAARLQKAAAVSTYADRYYLNVPGNGGTQNVFVSDPHIRLEKWAANHRTGMVNVESDLRGMTRPYNRDLVSLNDYHRWAPESAPSVSMPQDVTTVTHDTRITHPAWAYREAEIPRWEQPLVNPQMVAGRPLPFHADLNTRMIEADGFRPKMPTFGQYLQQSYAP